MSKHTVHSLEFALQFGARANLKRVQWNDVLLGEKGINVFFFLLFP
jgi:hypothetical protein